MTHTIHTDVNPDSSPHLSEDLHAEPQDKTAIEKFQDYWKSLDPKRQKTFIITGIISILLPVFTYTTLISTGLLSRAFVPVTPPTPPTPPSSPTTTPAQTESLLINPSFEFDANGDQVPDGWSRLGDGSDIRTNEFAHDGVFSFKTSGRLDKTKAIKQVISGNWPAGTSVYFSGWAKAAEVTSGNSVTIMLQVKYTDGSNKKVVLKFPGGSSFDWLKRSGFYVLPKTATQITVKNSYVKQTGFGYFDHMYLATVPQQGGEQPQKLAEEDLRPED